MVANTRFEQLKRQVEKLRGDSLNLIANANKILYRGVQKFADNELAALNDYYKSALTAIKKAERGNLKGAAKEQIDLLQETVNTVIAHARESVGVIAQARAELAEFTQSSLKGVKVRRSQLKKATAPAKKAVKNVKKEIKKAVKSASKTAKSTSKTAAKSVQSTEKSVVKLARKVRASGKSVAAEVSRAVAQIAPSPSSRAGRATSRAKKAASSAIDAVSSAAAQIGENVSAAFSGASSSEAPKTSEKTSE